jgi:hypothetical protein
VIDVERIVGDYLESIEEPFESTHPDHAWASEAESCARKIGFRIAGVPESNPHQFWSKWNFRLGSLIHLDLQESLAAKYKDDIEFEVSWNMDGIAGRADAVMGNEVFEFKSMNSFGFEGSVYGPRGANPKGADSWAILQAWLGAVALDKSRVRIFYATKQPTKKKPIVFGQWSFEWNEKADKMLATEIARMQGIAKTVADGELPRPVYDGKVIGQPVSTDFPCGYCGWQDACQQLPRGRIKLAMAHGNRGASAPQEQT